MIGYPDLTHEQAHAALETFLSERPVARRDLEMCLDGAVVLDGSTESLNPLWRWVQPQLRLGPSGRQPSWSRLSLGADERLDEGSLRLLDGTISYVVDILTDAFPHARWVVATDPHPRYLHQNQPMLRMEGWEQVPATTVGNLGRQVFSDWPPAEDRLAEVVGRWLAYGRAC